MSDERRTCILPVRVSPGERRRLKERAHFCGLPLSTYVRQTALGARPRQRRRRLEQDAIHQLARVGNNLNQLTRSANAMGRVELSNRLDEVLREILRTIARLA